jgi:hypothetical protein
MNMNMNNCRYSSPAQGVSYSNGIATITTRTRQSMVNVLLTARLTVEDDLPARLTDMKALAVGYLAMSTERDTLRAELGAAMAVETGRAEATAIQAARTVLAFLYEAANDFMTIYNTGDAPSGNEDEALRAQICAAERWLVEDAKAAAERDTIIRQGLSTITNTVRRKTNIEQVRDGLQKAVDQCAPMGKQGNQNAN